MISHVFLEEVKELPEIEVKPLTIVTDKTITTNNTERKKNPVV